LNVGNRPAGRFVARRPGVSAPSAMRAQAVEIAWHDESSVWSVGCSTSGRRFVTAGNDKVARVWRLTDDVCDALAAVSREQRKCASGLPPADDSPAAPAPPPRKLPVEWLCDLTGHAATVNAVRFAPNGSTIASGADRGEIIVWTACAPSDAGHETVAGGSGGGGGGGTRFANKARERWVQSCAIRGHSADVLDLSWCADAKRLASASVDNTIRVWDVTNPLRPLAVINHHDSIVQGVAFDPTGRLVASLGNDRALAVHSAVGFKVSGTCAVTAEEPKSHYFASDMSCNSVFRRLSWSPDGSFLACPSGLQVPETAKPHMYAVHLFARGQWTAPALQCAGLKTLPIAVSFCPQLFALRRDRASSSAPYFALPYRMVFAVACYDSVLLYDTESFGRPVARVAGVHYAELTDLAWTPDGSALLVSSTDGSVSVVALSSDEIGVPLPEDKLPEWMRERAARASAAAESGAGAPSVVAALEPVTPVPVVPRGKTCGADSGPPMAKRPAVTGPVVDKGGVREVTVVVPRRKPPAGVAGPRDGLTHDDPARKRLRLEEV
jgi:chromatin assembly factor 1 subunit B